MVSLRKPQHSRHPISCAPPFVSRQGAVDRLGSLAGTEARLPQRPVMTLVALPQPTRPEWIDSAAARAKWRLPARWLSGPGKTLQGEGPA